MNGSISREDLTECWCCGGLTERPSLCAPCDEAGCSRFSGECEADHIPVTDGGIDGRCPKCGSGDYDRDRGAGVVRCEKCGFASGPITTDGGVVTQQGIVGACTDCGGQMVETWRSLGDDRGHLGLECQDCHETGQIEYVLREENPWENPSVQEGVTDTTVEHINWIDCPKCHGHGWVEDPICDLRRAMNGREHPCPRCHTSGTAPRVAESDGGQGGER